MPISPERSDNTVEEMNRMRAEQPLLPCPKYEMKVITKYKCYHIPVSFRKCRKKWSYYNVLNINSSFGIYKVRVPFLLTHCIEEDSCNSTTKKWTKEIYVDYPINIYNLSPDTTRDDLQGLLELVAKPVPPLGKVFLSREKNSDECKGFAYVHFKIKKDAFTAIRRLNGYRFRNLFLRAKFADAKYSKPVTLYLNWKEFLPKPRGQFRKTYISDDRRNTSNDNSTLNLDSNRGTKSYKNKVVQSKSKKKSVCQRDLADEEVTFDNNSISYKNQFPELKSIKKSALDKAGASFWNEFMPKPLDQFRETYVVISKSDSNERTKPYQNEGLKLKSKESALNNNDNNSILKSNLSKSTKNEVVWSKSMKESVPDEADADVRNTHQYTYDITISNLPRHISYSRVKELVKPFGEFHEIYCPPHAGFAYVSFNSKADAISAILELNSYRVGHKGNVFLKARAVTRERPKNTRDFKKWRKILFRSHYQ